MRGFAVFRWMMGGGLLLVVGLLLLLGLAVRSDDQTHEQLDLLTDVSAEVVGLMGVTQDVVHTLHPRAIRQWHARHLRLQGALDRVRQMLADGGGSHGHADDWEALAALQGRADTLGTLFGRVFGERAPLDRERNPLLEQVVFTQLTSEMQSLWFDVSRWQRQLTGALYQNHRWLVWGALAGLVLLAGQGVIAAALRRHRLVKPLQDLVRLARADSREAPTPLSSRPPPREFAQVAVAIHQLHDTLRQTRRELMQRETELAEARQATAAGVPAAATNEERLNRMPEELVGLVSVAVRDARTLAMTGGVRIDYRPAIPEAPILADEASLRQVLDHLLTAAIGRSPADTVIAVAVQSCAGDTGFQEYRVTIEDRGEGVVPDLSRCRGIIDAHQGRMGVACTPGRGTMSWFTIPAAERRVGGGPAFLAATA